MGFFWNFILLIWQIQLFVSGISTVCFDELKQFISSKVLIDFFYWIIYLKLDTMKGENETVPSFVHSGIPMNKGI